MPKIIDAELEVQDKFGPLGKPTTLVVHHGQSPRDIDDRDALRLLRVYHREHQSKGWGGIGYHFAVTTAGTLVKCRPVGLKGAHAPPNSGRIGVVLIGDYRTDRPSMAQIDTLRWLYHQGQPVGVPNGLKLGGHRDFVSTDCPGDRLYAALPRVRKPSVPGVPVDKNPAPHRDLRITDPPTKGEDVVKLQHAVKRLSGPRKYGLPDIGAEDKTFGRRTLGNRPQGSRDGDGARGVGYYLGAPDNQLTGPCREHLQVIIRAPKRRTVREKVRGKARYIRRRRELRRVNTPQLKAQYIEDSLHVHWASWLSTGSDERRLDEIESPEHGTDVWVPHFRRYAKLNTRILDFLYDCAKAGEKHGGVVIVNAWTGGVHSSDASRHYIDAALDLAVQSTLRYPVMAALWAKHGATRNFERDHIHLDFPRP